MWVILESFLGRKIQFLFLFSLGDPTTNEKATTDPYKTLFIARLVCKDNLELGK